MLFLWSNTTEKTVPPLTPASKDHMESLDFYRLRAVMLCPNSTGKLVSVKAHCGAGAFVLAGW